MSKDSITDRLVQYTKYKDIAVNAFEKSLGKAPSYLRNSKDITTGVLQKIRELYPDINVDWLLTGEGSMLKDSMVATGDNTEDINRFLRERLKEGKSAKVIIPLEKGTPLLPIEAWGGSLNGSSIAVLASQCDRYNIPISNIDYLIPIAGDSMIPDYCPGDIVAIKRINESAFIEWGKVYVLDTCNGVVIKEVQPNDREGRITCISHNRPEKYKPFEVSLDPEHFFGMYAVKGIIRIS